MELFRVLSVVGALLFSTVMWGQRTLPESGKASARSYIYTISKENLRDIYFKDKVITEDMPGKLITEFSDNDIPRLPAGNYLIVKAVEEKLHFTDYTVDDLSFRMLPAEEFMLCLHDSVGNMITDATVRKRSGVLKFDKATRTYNTKNVKDEEILEINHNGVYHYIEVESYHDATERNRFKIPRWRGKRYSPADNFTGFVVFSKPRYKPGERVKLKGYIARNNGKPYDKPVKVRLYNSYSLGTDTVLTTLQPYPPGMYAYEFDLSDELALRLDTDYSIILESESKPHNTIEDRFRYEDYELKGLNFSMKTDREEYAKKDPIKLMFEVADENELPVYDGNIQLVVTSNPLSLHEIKYTESGFLPDILWTHTVSLDEIPEREIVLPDSIFPTDIPLTFTVSATFLSADNEKKTASVYLSKSVDDCIIDEQLSYRFYREKDSVFLQVNNPAEIPYWYTVRRGNREILRGYTTDKTFAHAVKGGNDGYAMRLCYFFGEEHKVIEKNLPAVRKNIAMDVSTPATVYPGQKTDVRIKVTDKKGKPVEDVDITAYAFTSKFKNYTMPRITIHGKAKYARRFVNANYEVDDAAFYNRKTHMTWPRWNEVMKLDTMAYYNFLYPDTSYIYTEPTPDGTTLISPYLVMDGALQMVHMLWIDERLYYTSAAGQANGYVFPVEPGEHRLRFRTREREIFVEDVNVKPGARNIFSFNVESLGLTSVVLKDKEQDFPNKEEQEYLTEQLITVDTHFGTIQLPNLRKTIDIPGYIRSGKMYYYLNQNPTERYDNILRGMVKRPVLAGPFPQRDLIKGKGLLASVYRGSGELLSHIQLEGGNKYTIYPGYQKIKSWDESPFIKNNRKAMLTPDFRTNPMSEETIWQHAENRLLALMKESTGPACPKDEDVKLPNPVARLTLWLGKDTQNNKLTPALICIVPEGNSLEACQLYYGGTRQFTTLPAGRMNISLIFNDFTSYTRSIDLRAGGVNFLCLDSLNYDPRTEIAAKAFEILNRGVSTRYSTNPYLLNGDEAVTTILTSPDSDRYKKKNMRQGIISGIVRNDMGEPLIGASVSIPGTSIGTITNIDGYFELQGVSSGDQIWITYIGYTPQTLICIVGREYDIRLSEDNQSLEEMVVVVSGVVPGIAMSNTTTTVQELPADVEQEPSLTVPNAVLFERNMDEGNTMRRNFHDDAFWQPRLRTDKNGEAAFEVVYPDDITHWNAYFIAVGGKKQTDKRQITIRSYKTLSAALSTPRFAVRGDSLCVVGKITNYQEDTISVNRKFETAGQSSQETLSLTNSHVEYIPVKTVAGDSLAMAYSMQLPDGYFDGEERSIPIIEQGLWQTFGEFKVLNDAKTYTFAPKPGCGKTRIHAEASGVDLFLKEIEKVDRYPYMCNEQMASKIKALLARKRIGEMFNRTFNDDEKINKLIRTINKNRNDEGRWGWWNRSKTEGWVSQQVIDALLDAAEAGFDAGLDVEQLIAGLTAELQSGLTALEFTTPEKVPYARQELLNRLILLKRLGAPADYASHLSRIDVLPAPTLADKLKALEARVQLGMKDEVNPDSLMRYARQSMFGSLYWGEKNEARNFHSNFLLPYRNNTQNTLMAYKILKALGGYDEELNKIRNYFFECRRGGNWSNTYESSRVIETIMPDMLTPEQTFADASLTINNRTVTTFPFTEETSSDEPLRVSKSGTVPVFFSTYQQAWNSDPDIEAGKGFGISTTFTANADTVSYLTAGQPVQLEVKVTVDAEARYVQIEVPIPAGCTYHSKHRPWYGREAHREHFKDRVVIFCDELAEGEHRFTVDLMPRFSGKYTLNPAKAELMYYPVFYGNNKKKTVVIDPRE